MTFRVVRSRRIYHDIVNQIKAAIEAGRFQPGDRLPSEREMADAFGVGRTSVREALRTLETEGLIVIRHGQGAFIADRELNGFADHFAELLMQNECTPIQILEARCGIELHLARLAALKRTDEDVEELKTCIREMEVRINRGLPPTEPDQAFHLGIAEAAANIILLNLFENIIDLMQRPIWLNAKNAVLQDVAIARKYLGQHKMILTAIEAQEPERAAALMYEHLEAIQRDQLAKASPVQM